LPLAPPLSLCLASGEVLDNILEKDLQTALPKTGGRVMILHGEHKGNVANLLERYRAKIKGKDGKQQEDEVAVAQIDQTLEVVTLSLDDVAEYAGRS
jgi:hypothetical protein